MRIHSFTAQFQYPQPALLASCVTMSADQKLMAAGSNTGRVMMWDIERRELMWEHSMHAGRVEALAFNTIMQIASAGADGRIRCVCVCLLMMSRPGARID